MLDKYIGQCVIHELYYAELGVAGDTCASHDPSCGWINDFLEMPLDEYAAELGQQE